MSTDFHIEILQKEFDRRIAKNPQYSLRGFARDLSVSASWLSEVFKNKKGISEGTAEKLCLALKLSRQDSKLFVLSVRARYSRSNADRDQASNDLRTNLERNDLSKKFSKNEQESMVHWVYDAILEMIELDHCEHTPEWLAREINLPSKIIVEALAKMQDLNLLTFKGNKFQSVYKESETSYDISSDSLREYHRQILKKAESALNQQPIHQREFINMTLSFDKSEMEEAKKAIRQFQRSFADRFYPQNGPKNSVYQFSLQLFRVDQGSKNE
ncbi:hypothetical protein D3C87_1227250 [compost metagenome]